MQKSIFFRRVLSLLLVALLLWAVLTALLYSFISRPLFTRIKVGELQPKAETIAAMAAQALMRPDPYFNELITSAQSFFESWIFVVDGLSGEFRNTVLPAEYADAEPKIREQINSRMEMILSGDYTSVWFTGRLPLKTTDEMLYIGVPVTLRFGLQSTIIGAVFFVQPLKELNAGLNSLNIALLVSSLLVFLLMILPAYYATARLIRPLRQTRDVALAMSSGDFSARADSSQKGEIGELAATMNNLAQELSHTISDLILERNRLQQILASMSDGLIAIDCTGTFTQANPAALGLLGLADDPEQDPLASNTELSDCLTKAIKERRPADRLFQMDGRSIRVQAAPLIANEDQLAGAVALLHDVTESERLEQTRRDYVANVSHELRSPLTAMRALIEPLSDGMVTAEEDRRRYYDILLREIIRLSRLIDDMLELSRLQAGILPIQQESFSLSSMLDDLALRYGAQAEERRLTLALPANRTACPVVRGDPDRIEQVLIILLDNAIKFTPAGGRISLELDWQQDQVMVRVRDDGIGISPADIPHVFDRFYKADKAHQQPGTGLGLSIAREILQLMNQTITVHSKPGEGTVFTFTLARETAA
ncbi:MAG: cell wall metabolism sensor histidine kinase WalK [Clostridiaceae bacterium]|nr:cell wall metabolism sensor histidine kinase WalK [Clostridiaceae bacterium]